MLVTLRNWLVIAMLALSCLHLPGARGLMLCLCGDRDACCAESTVHGSERDDRHLDCADEACASERSAAERDHADRHRTDGAERAACCEGDLPLFGGIARPGVTAAPEPPATVAAPIPRWLRHDPTPPPARPVLRLERPPPDGLAALRCVRLLV